MEFELHPSIVLQSGTWSILIAPESFVVQALNERLSTIERFLVLYVCGNYSRVLSKIHRRYSNFDIQRSFTAFQLLRILDDSHHTFIFVEYDPTLFDEDTGLVEHLPQAFTDVARHATIVLHTPVSDRIINELAKHADRVFCLGLPSPERRTAISHAGSHLAETQTTLEAF